MACPRNQTVTLDGAGRIAREVGRSDDADDDRLKVCSGEADADQSAQTPIGQLDQADAQDERAYGHEDSSHVVSVRDLGEANK
jgi:hypothetical protein